MLVVLEDQAIVQPGEVQQGVALGKGTVLAEAPVSSLPAAPTIVASPQTPATVATVAAPTAPQAKVESRGLAPAVFTPPTFLIRKEPVYPDKTRRAGIEGRVVLKIFISAAGEIRSTEVLVSSGNQALDQSALQAVRASRFSPALSDHLPVESHATASYRFELR